MPRKNHQKIKKRKKKVKKPKQPPKPKYHVKIPLTLSSDCKDMVIIEAQKKHNAIFVLKERKWHANFNSEKAYIILSTLDHSRKRWDIICNIASWCHSFSKQNRGDDNFWKKYIKSFNKNRHTTIPEEELSSIIQLIEDMFEKCIGSTYFYARDNWEGKISAYGKDKVIMLADYEIDLVSVGYLRNHIKNINNYYIPKDILTLCGHFYGYLSDYMFDRNMNRLFVSADPESRRKHDIEKSPFVGYDKYAIRKAGWTLEPRTKAYFKFSARVLELQQNFGIGVAIFNEEMSENLNNGKWILNKEKYLKNVCLRKYDRGKYDMGKRLTNSHTFMKNDVCTVAVTFCQDSVTEYTTQWILTISVYKNTEFIGKQLFITKAVYFTENEYKDVKRMCHLVIYNKSSALNLQLIESIDSSIIAAIEWWRYLNTGDCVQLLDDRYVRCYFIGHINVNENVLTLRRYGFRADECIQIYNDDIRILKQSSFYKYGADGVTIIDIANIFDSKFQLVSIM